METEKKMSPMELGMKELGPKIMAEIQRIFGRDLEFLICAFDRGLRHPEGMPTCYFIHTFSTQESVMEVVHASIGGALAQASKDPNSPVNLH